MIVLVAMKKLVWKMLKSMCSRFKTVPCATIDTLTYLVLSSSEALYDLNIDFKLTFAITSVTTLHIPHFLYCLCYIACHCYIYITTGVICSYVSALVTALHKE